MVKYELEIKDPKVNDCIKLLLDNGGRVFIVGGYVRDYLLGTASEDIDIEVYNISFDTLKKLFKDQMQIQTNFGIFILKNTNAEFAIPRYENKIGIKHQDFEINLNPFMDFNKATSRRDFTINALMYDIQENTILDFHNGLEDLHNKILKHVSSKFIEDPLRILRALRFSAILGFKIDQSTLILCEQMLKDLIHISPARKNQELSKFIKADISNFKIGFSYFSILIPKYYNIKFKDTNRVKNSIFLCNINQNMYGSDYKILFWTIILININDQSKINYILNDTLINKKEIKTIEYLVHDYQNIDFNNSDYIYKSFNTYKEKVHLLVELYCLQSNLYNKLYADNDLILIYTNNKNKYKITNNIYKKIFEKFKSLNGYFYLQQGYKGKEIKDMQKRDLIKYINKLIKNN